MKNLFLISSLVAAVSVANFAQANTGEINFTGELTAATCTVTGGTGGTAGVIDVDLGTVSIADLGTGAPGDFGAETGINMDIDCAGAGGFETVKMHFSPRSGSGLDANDNRLLQITEGGAAGVGIGLINDANELVNLGTGETVETALVAGQDGAATATLNLRAAYIISDAPALAAGVANGDMPFTLSYE